MLFLIRTAFWLIIIVLLLPTDERQRSEVYGTAQAAMNDVVTFCDRNPETCAKGKDAFGVFVQKAQFGARMLIDLVNGRTRSGRGRHATCPPPNQPPSRPPSQVPRPRPFSSRRVSTSADRRTRSVPRIAQAAWAGPGT